MSTALAVSPEMTEARNPYAPQGDHAARRVKSPRATSRPKPQVAERPRKVSFYLSSDVIKRLGVAASMEESDRSRVVERILRDNLKEWVVQYRGRGSSPEAGVEDLDDRATV